MGYLAGLQNRGEATGFPQHGRSPDDVQADLQAKREHEVKLQDGRAFAMVCDGGPGVHEVAERAAALYLHENALNTKAFPSLGHIQSEVVGWTLACSQAPDCDPVKHCASTGAMRI